MIRKLARSLRAFHREEPAQTLVEFAIVLPIFLLIVTGLMDTARALGAGNSNAPLRFSRFSRLLGVLKVRSQRT